MPGARQQITAEILGLPFKAEHKEMNYSGKHIHRQFVSAITGPIRLDSSRIPIRRSAYIKNQDGAELALSTWDPNLNQLLVSSFALYSRASL